MPEDDERQCSVVLHSAGAGSGVDSFPASFTTLPLVPSFMSRGTSGSRVRVGAAGGIFSKALSGWKVPGGF